MKILKITVLRYSIQLILSALFVRHNDYVYFCLVGGIFPYLIKHTKTRNTIDNILFLVSLKYKMMFFLSYGYTVVNTYKSVRLLCLSSIRYYLTQFVFTFEILGYITNFIYSPNHSLGFILAILQFINIFTLISPPIEESDLATILKRIRYLIEDEYIVRSEEYKEIIKLKNKTSTIKYVHEEKNLGYEELKDIYVSDSVPEEFLEYVEKDKKRNEVVLKNNLYFDFLTPIILLSRDTSYKLILLTLSLIPIKKYDFFIFFFAFFYILNWKISASLLSLFTNFSNINNYIYLRIISLVLFFYLYKILY